MSITRRVVLVVCAGALLAASAPTVATGVEKVTDVFITNGDDRPVPTKAIGTTSVSGAVSVPAGVEVTNTPSVAVPDGVSINGPVSVRNAATERFNLATGAFHTGGGEACTPIEVPEDRRLVVEAVHFQLNAGDMVHTYLRQVTNLGVAGFVFERFRPVPTAGPNGRLEGPFIGDDKSALSICARESASLRAVVVGILETP